LGKVDFKSKLIKDKEGNFISIKRAIHQEVITIVNIYALSASTPNLIKQTLLDIKAQINLNIMSV
jgi:hypothetical protein